MTDRNNKAEIGVVGLGVMGANLAANIESRGIRVAVWNRHQSVMDRFIETEKKAGFVPAQSPQEFVSLLSRPRTIVVMVTAGKPVDMVIDQFVPLLEAGDILIDGGNSFYKDTRRREAYLKQKGIHFMGLGVSGGEEGARRGPSLMPGGTEYAYNAVKNVLTAIAAVTDSGPCVTHVGPDGAGHFVKMVHNGIEYADMQILAEVYDLLRKAGGKTAPEIGAIFAEWNRGPLASFLVELSSQVLRVIDRETHRPLVDMVMDQAGQKGTGRWTALSALELGVPVPSIAAAVDARGMSMMKEQRVAASKVYSPIAGASLDDAVVARCQDALVAARILIYAQGLYLVAKAGTEYQWRIDCTEVARIWKGGCIIRAALLDDIMAAFSAQGDLVNLVMDDVMARMLIDALPGLRSIVSVGAVSGVPMPVLGASLGYIDAYVSAQLPHNFTQAQRDAFGAHTYQRIDRPEDGFIHSDWSL